MDIRSDRQKGMSYAEISRKYHIDPRTAKKYAESDTRPVYSLTEPKPSKLDPYKEQISVWLEEAPYSAVRILEKIKERGFEGEYSIVKHFVRGKKEQLEEKATVRFETMPGLQGQVDWAFFEDHMVEENGKQKKLYYFVSLLPAKYSVFGASVMLPDDTGVFVDAVHRVCDGHEYQYADPLPPKRVPVLSWIPGGNPV